MRLRTSGLIAAVLLLALRGAHAEDATSADRARSDLRIQVYGFLELMSGYDFDRTDPNWYDVLRPSKLPDQPGEFGPNGTGFTSIRPSRLGVKGFFPSGVGEFRTTFECDLFGSGSDVGRTAFRLRLASVEIGPFGAGLVHSPFTDPDIAPAALEFYGPSGMLDFRNVALFWRPIDARSRLTIALERPGASGDEGIYANRIDLQDVTLHFPYPDLSAAYRLSQPWGHIQASMIGRTIRIEDTSSAAPAPSTRIFGWGVSLSSNFQPDDTNVLHLQLVWGRGIENYVRDAPVDVAPETSLGPQPRSLAYAKALPVFGFTAFLDHRWRANLSSAIGYSLVNITNSDGQQTDAFKRGHYALLNLVYDVSPRFLVGGELQWARRENFSNDFHANDLRLQFTVKYSFSTTWHPSR